MNVAKTVALGLLLPSTALAWGTHDLVTDRALDRVDVTVADKSIPVESLDDFLKANPDKVKALFTEYYAWLGQRGSTQFKAQVFDTTHPTVAEFLRTARLNPKANLAYVSRVMPGQPDDSSPVDPKSISPYLPIAPPLDCRFGATKAGSQVTVRQVLDTYVDEPDWGIDHELWGIADYGYGAQPYGKPTGESSKAPFHMQFAHENVIVRKFASDFTKGMVVDRVEMDVRLSKLAFQTGHPYWGYRFAAWAMHYVEDLGQPFHSKAVASAGTMYYVGYVLSPMKKHIAAKTTQLELNRHFIYEDFVSNELQASYTTHDAAPTTLAGDLVTGELVFKDVSDAAGLVEAVGSVAADHGQVIDRTIKKAYPSHWTNDWHVDVETDKAYDINAMTAKMPADKNALLLAATAADFDNTGRAARTVLRLVGAQ